jgi:hypothetical protein
MTVLGFISIALVVSALNFLITLALVGWIIIPSIHAIFDVTLPYWGTVGLWFALTTLLSHPIKDVDARK